MNFPKTKEEFETLKNESKIIEYSETNSESEIPEGDGWEFWSMKKTDTEEKTVWRRIINIEE